MSQAHLPKKMVDMVSLEKILVKQVQVCPVSGFFLENINLSWEKKSLRKIAVIKVYDIWILWPESFPNDQLAGNKASQIERTEPYKRERK